MTAPMLEVRDVSVTFGGVAALTSVSLTVGAGEIVAVIGPNGAGKSTLFNALTGLAPLSAGSISLKGAPLKRRLRLVHVLCAAAMALFVGLWCVLLQVGPEAAFEQVVVRPYEVTYVAQDRARIDGPASAAEPSTGGHLQDLLEGAPSIGASWRGYQVWLPEHVKAGPVWPTLSEARQHATVVRAQRAALVGSRTPRHIYAGGMGLVLGAAMYALMFARSRRTPDHIARMGIARTFQNLRLFGAMSVLDNVRVAQKSPVHAVDTAYALLQRVNLAAAAHRPANALAYGDMRRLEIARALATEPSVLLLDEPAAGMNATETRDLQVLIHSIRAQGIAVLLIEHDMPLVMDVADRVIVLEYGIKIADGPPQVVQADPKVIGAYLGDTDASAPQTASTVVVAEAGNVDA